jgi:phosphate:Na+ symporter
MQSSTAAVALTLSAHFAGAVGLDQGCALIIGQNIGTATSSAIAALGASTTAQRLAVAYILFKLIAAAIALVLFPVVTHLLVRASSAVHGVTLLAAYHTAYNLVGVAVLLPVIESFTRLVERMLPERSSPLVRCLDPSALANPIVAVEAVRRTVARALAAMCSAIEAALGVRPPGKESVADTAAALRQAQVFMSDVSGPPETDDEQQRLTRTLHALDHASRFAETAAVETTFAQVKEAPEDARAAELCGEAMRDAAAVAGAVAAGPDPSAAATEAALVRLERCAQDLGELRRSHRATTLSAVAPGALSADAAITRVDTVRRLEALAHHAWRAAAYLAARRGP